MINLFYAGGNECALRLVDTALAPANAVSREPASGSARWWWSCWLRSALTETALIPF